MDYWNGGMLHRTYLIIQHVLYSEQCLITGNIRVCCGRRQKYSKPALPLHNLCVRHKEWQLLVSWTTGKQDLEMFTSTVTYPVSRLCGQVSVRRCYTFPKCGCSALTCPHQAYKASNARAIVTELFSLSDCTHTVCEKGKIMTICNQV